ncbi:hypothetical protein PG995_004612 [Apiospora arundinis]
MHGLHCLEHIRKNLIQGELDIESWHIQHCFNHLRQSLMCNVDLKLNAMEGDDLQGLDNEAHVCRDFDAIVGWVDANRWDNFWNWHFSHGVVG